MLYSFRSLFCCNLSLKFRKSLYSKMSLEWWKKNIVYHVYLPAFKDGNDDGIGDFKGLIEKLDYFQELKISSLLLSPFYPSPMKDNGYDISSYTDIDPMYGSMNDFDQFMEEVKDRGMNVIVDFVANHTSDQHIWFKKSVLREDPFTDFYIWIDPLPGSTIDKPLPPNNWLSVFDGSAWTWNEHRKQFYFHQFLPEQPDLNYRNPLVREEAKKILKFWLDKGVDGFRIDAASHLMEDERLIDEPLNKKSKTKNKEEYQYLNHIYTKGNEENLDLIEEWKHVLDDYSARTNKPKILLVEATEEIEDNMYYYGTFERKLAEVPLNFQLYKVKPDFTGTMLHKLIDDWLSKMPKGKYPNWVMSSHDDPRVVTRVGITLASSLHMVMMLLPGLPFWYYGDELGMENGTIQPQDMKDSYALRTVPSNSRDPMRTPMQWNSGKNAGFSNSDLPWLPINSSYLSKNVEEEKKDPFSFLSNFKKLLAIRDQPAILFSSIQYPVLNEKIFSVLRSIVGAKCYLLVLNMHSEPLTINMTDYTSDLPQEAILEVTNCPNYHTSQFTGQNHIGDVKVPSEFAAASAVSGYASVSGAAAAVAGPSTSFASESTAGAHVYEAVKVSLSNIYLEPHQAIVLSYIG